MRTSVNFGLSPTEQCTQFAKLIFSAGSVEELSMVLSSLLTPAEIESISQRLCILDGLSAGVAQREIAETLRVGIATVTRGSRAWQDYRKTLERYFPRGEGIQMSSLPELPEGHSHVQAPAHVNAPNIGVASQQRLKNFGTALPEI